LWRGSFKGRQSSTFWTLGCWSCRGRVKTTMYVYSCTYRHASPTRLYISLHIPKNITPAGLRRQRDMALLDSSDLFQSRRSTTTLHDDPIQTRHTCGSFPIDPRQYIPSLPSQIVLVTARRLLTRGCAIGSGANILHQPDTCQLDADFVADISVDPTPFSPNSLPIYPPLNSAEDTSVHAEYRNDVMAPAGTAYLRHTYGIQPTSLIHQSHRGSPLQSPDNHPQTAFRSSTA
jgi:hypothetical protein